MYLQDEQRMQGLVYLLSLALRGLTLLEWVARERLRQEGRKLHSFSTVAPRFST
jgi:transposase